MKCCIPIPGFPGYASITLGLGGVPVPFMLSGKNHLQPDPEEIAPKITPRTKILITNSPGNPTGTVYTDEVQRQLAELAVKHDLLVLSDEIYARIIYGGTYVSMMSYPGMEERTLIIDGFSKSFAMTGWRLGYATAPPSIQPGVAWMRMPKTIMARARVPGPFFCLLPGLPPGRRTGVAPSRLRPRWAAEESAPEVLRIVLGLQASQLG